MYRGPAFNDKVSGSPFTDRYESVVKQAAAKSPIRSIRSEQEKERLLKIQRARSSQGLRKMTEDVGKYALRMHEKENDPNIILSDEPSNRRNSVEEFRRKISKLEENKVFLDLKTSHLR